MRRFLMPLLLVIVCLGACQKGGTTSSPPPEAKNEPPPPADVIATVTFAHAATFVGHLGKYVDKVAPGMGARLDGAMLTQGFASMTNAGSLEGIDLDKPVRIILLDPKKHTQSPVVLLASFADVEKLKKGAGQAKVEAQDGRALVGADAEIAAVKTWAFGTLAGQAAPESPTAEVWLDRVMLAYRADIENFAKQMASMNLGATVQAVLKGEIEVLLAVGEQSDRMMLSLDAADDDAALNVALAPKAGTALARFVAAQKPFDGKLLNGIPSTEHPAMVMIGHTELGELSEPMYRWLGPILAQIADKPFDESFHKLWQDWLKLFTGDFAAITWLEGGATAMNEIISVTDGKAAQKMVQEFLAGLKSPKKVSFMGIDMTFTGGFGAAQHGDASIDTVAVAIDTTNMPALQQEMMKRMYPDGMKMAYAGWGKTFGIAIGPKSADQMNALIDNAGKPPALSPFVQAAVDGSVKRKESMVMVMNLAAMMAPLSQGPPAQSGMIWTLGFSDGRAALRMDLPAAHIGEMMGAFRNAAQPPR